MKNINVQKRIDLVKYLFKEIETNNNQFEAQLTYFLLVTVFGTAQYCIKTLYIDWINPSMTNTSLNILKKQINFIIQTPDLANIKKLLLLSNKEIVLNNYSVYNNLVTHRHLFAHGEKDPTKLEDVTLLEVKRAFNDLCLMLEEIEKVLS